MSASPPPDVDAEKQGSVDQGDDTGLPGGAQEMGGFYEMDVKEQDRWLPIANVARIMKQALPDNAKIAKEAKECMQECVSEFISFITSEAAEKCQLEKRKTVNGEDILFAMTSLGFENYGEALKIYLARFRESTATKNAEHSSGARPSGAASASANSHAASQVDPASATRMQAGDQLPSPESPDLAGTAQGPFGPVGVAVANDTLALQGGNSYRGFGAGDAGY